ncbi:toxin-antitoxin system YwqK family antitoxin [Spirosoma gilvum]
MNTFYLVMFVALTILPAQVQAQADSVRSTSASGIRRSHADYDEEIVYFGKHNQYFTVKVFRKNGELFRLDTYNLLPKTLSNGFQLDSLSRIIHHGTTKIMYPSGKVYVSCEYKDGALHGPFMAFYEDGSVKRREYYRYGRLSKSQCYTAEGTEQRCDPFYQPAKFLGNPKDLQTYLTQKLESVVDGDRIRRVTATLSINEIGQVIRVSVAVSTSPYAEQQVQAVGSYVQQVIRNMPEWTPDKMNWKPAINDGVATASTCTMSVFRFSGMIRCYVSYQL